MPVPLIFVLVGLAALTAFWPWILHYLTTQLMPWVNEHIGTLARDAIATVVSVIDHGISPVRHIIRTKVREFKELVFGINNEYVKTSATSATCRTTTFINVGNGRIEKLSSEQTLDWDEIPAEIRDRMIREQTKAAMMDVREQMLNQVEDKMRSEGMTLDH